MKTELVRSRNLERVHDALLAIARALADFGDQEVCILHCMQPHRSNFYRQLEQDFGVSTLLCHPHKGFKAAFERILLGSSALIVIDRYDQLPSLFSRIGEQTIAALYLVDKSVCSTIPNLSRLNASEIVALIMEFPTHLVFKVDEDSAGEDGQVLEYLSIGEDCPQVLKEAVAFEGEKISDPNSHND
ncbi:MAG: hypothetical protein EG824_14750 [Deltaproteobacteria bacterium]|nr:hypothetical protein [Deltaproteobacteria bacterium]